MLVKGAAEALVIALGVFLAISAESWWQERADRREEVQHLIALREDFVQSLVLLDEAEDVQDRQVQFLQFFLQGKAKTADSKDVREWITLGLFYIGTYQPQMSALQDLESSGQMQLIQDPKLRRALAAMQQDIDELETSQSDFIESQQTLIDPYLVAQLDLASILTTYDSSYLDSQSAKALDLSIFESVELRSRIAFKLSLRKLVSDSQQDVRAQFEHVLSLIKIQLDSVHAE